MPCSCSRCHSQLQHVCKLPWQLLCHAALSQLTQLRLDDNRLRDLPDGTYLDSLRHLELSDNQLRSIPQARACCSVHKG